MNNFFRNTLPIITTITLPLLLGTSGYFLYTQNQYQLEQNARWDVLVNQAKEQIAKNNFLEEQIDAQATLQKRSLENTAANLTESLQEINNDLNITKTINQEVTSALAATILAEKEKLEKIDDSLIDLEKLSQIDEELLLKYSKVSFLNEHYVPSDLSEIKNYYLYSEKQTQMIHTDVSPYLTNMLDKAVEEGVIIYVKSAYRSFNEQDLAKASYTILYGPESANQFSADQGFSEHQLGTTIDFITPGLGGQLDGFGNTPAYTWLKEHGHEYGFIESYPDGNAYYIPEPWHWRFVGRELAKTLYEDDEYFYDLDQRVIDEYIITLFD